MSFLKKIRARGFVNSIEICFNRIVPAWLFRFSIGDVLVFDLDLAVASDSSTSQDAGQSKSGVAFRRINDPAMRQRLRKATWNSVPIESTTDDLGYGILQSDHSSEILGGVWGGVDGFVEQNLGFRFAFAPDQAWIYCAYVDDSLRGQGAYQRLLTFALNDLRQNGYSRIYVMIQPWNHASIHVHRKFASGKLGRVAVLRILKFAWVVTSGSLTRSKSFTGQIESNPVEIRLR